MKRFNALTILAFGSVAFATGSAVASTQAIGESTIEVRYDDLNLSNTKGIAAVNRRIRLAADRACGGRDSRELWHAVEYQRCTLDARAKALAQINWPKSNRS